MTTFKQLSLFNTTSNTVNSKNTLYLGKDLGTFKDSLRSPVYRWFRYPAGYSYKFVFESINLFNVAPGNWIYDPFSGSGTTLIAAKQLGINAYGVEAHSFVHWVASVKLYWEFEPKLLREKLLTFLNNCKSYIAKEISNVEIDGVFPELIYKCYHPQDLMELYLIREKILNEDLEYHFKNLLKLALTDTLRAAAAAGTGWPYISPNKNTGDKPPKDAFKVFEEQTWLMYSDLLKIGRRKLDCTVQNVLGDSRKKQEKLKDGMIELALTSPPYLNNYDYADRTRLETYFWGITESWKEITEKFRKKLIVAATTQVTRSDHEVENALSEEINKISPEIYDYIQSSILELAELRLQKGGRKDYDLMVALYFNDLLEIIRETYRVLKSGGRFCLVLGDSAPYGVYLPTHELLAKIGLGVGFGKYEYYQLRKRGGKWKDNPQRHSVSLQEGIVVLTK